MLDLSVIIPAYNAERYLAAAVQSVLSQNCPAPEIIIVNDGSTDATGQIAQQLSLQHSTIRVIHSENRGAAHARNLGLDAACGRYVVFLDADDVWCLNAIDPSVEALLHTGQYDILSFGFVNAEPALQYGRLTPERSGCLQKENPEFNQAASRKSFCSYIFRRSLVGTIRFPDGIRYNEDTTFLFLVTRRARNLLQLDRYLFIYRNNLHSAMHAALDWRYILTDEIPAWYWARQQALPGRDQLDCDGMVYSLMQEYLRLSAMWGTSSATLLEDVRHCLPFREVMSRFGHFWTQAEAVAFYREFTQNPKRVCHRLRLHGVFHQTLRTVSRTAPVRRLYLRLKYRTPLTDLVPRLDALPQG